MIRYSLLKSSKPISLYEIESLNEELGFNLPEDFCHFYLLNNGGQIEGNRNIFVDEDEDEYIIKYIAPIKYVYFDSQYTIEKLWETFIVKKKLIPPTYIPFCLEGSGFPICYNINKGHISFANIEHFDKGEDMLEPIALSLEDFINGMKTEDEAYG